MLGAAAAQRLGHRPGLARRADLGRRPCGSTSPGILNPAVLAPEIDSSVLVGFPAAENYLGFDGHPSTDLRPRARTSQVTAVDSLLAARPTRRTPAEVDVSQPSAALTAQADAAGRVQRPVPGPGRGRPAGRRGRRGQHHGHLGAGTPLSEIGLRRALGATRGQIRTQFLSEAILLALLGGAAGVVARRARHRHLRPRQGLGHRHPARGLGRRPGRRPAHRRPRRAAARHPGRPPVTHPGPVDPVTCTPARAPAALPHSLSHHPLAVPLAPRGAALSGLAVIEPAD